VLARSHHTENPQPETDATTAAPATTAWVDNSAAQPSVIVPASSPPPNRR
jgi:hypothetical protein